MFASHLHSHKCVSLMVGVRGGPGVSIEPKFWVWGVAGGGGGGVRGASGSLGVWGGGEGRWVPIGGLRGHSGLGCKEDLETEVDAGVTVTNDSESNEIVHMHQT